MKKRPRKTLVRRKRSAAARLRRFWIVFILLVFVGLIGGFYAASWPGFQPKNVRVSGNRSVSSHEIAARAAIDRHSNLWLQDMAAAAARVAAIPGVETATIDRGLPALVHIQVTERAPFARLVYDRGEIATVDRRLRVLDDPPDAHSLPRIFVQGSPPRPGAFVKDPRAARLLADYERLSSDHVIVILLRYDRFGDLIAATPRGVELLLGEDDDLARKAALIGPILSQTGGKRIAAVDLRAPSTPVVVYRK